MMPHPATSIWNVNPDGDLLENATLSMEEEAHLRAEAFYKNFKGGRGGRRVSLQRAGLLVAARSDASAMRRWFRPRDLSLTTPHPLRETPLHCAARAGDVATLQELLDGGANVDVLDECQRAPLELASAGGHVGALRLLLHRGAANQWERLRAALAVVGSEDAAHVILEERTMEMHGPFAEDLLWHAAKLPPLYSVRVLLAAGVDADASDHEGFTVLHHAAMYGHVDLAKLLLTKSVLRDRTDVSKRTALHVAAEHGHSDIAKLLLKSGWTPLMHDDGGCTPLHYASQWGHADCVNALLQGAGPELVDAVDSMGRTALHYAAGGDMNWIYMLLGEISEMGEDFHPLQIPDDYDTLPNASAFITFLRSFYSN